MFPPAQAIRGALVQTAVEVATLEQLLDAHQLAHAHPSGSSADIIAGPDPKGQHDAPRTITLDGHAASHRAVRELKADGLLPAEMKLRSSKYLNNLIEQDHGA